MKRIILAALLLLTPGVAKAQFDTEGWGWVQSLTQESVAPGFVRLQILPAIFDESQASLHDLRVLGPDGNLVPHILRWESAVKTASLAWRDVTLINSVFEPNVHSRVTLDFGESLRKNIIRVQLSDTNYRRRVAIEGSPDNERWDLIVEDQWLFDIHQGGKEFVLDTISFPVNDYRYLRLTAHYMEDDPRQVTIRKAESAFREEVAEKLTPVPVASLTQHRDEKTGESVLEADLGFKNLPLGRIGMQIHNTYFHRGVSIRGRNSRVEIIPRNTETGWDKVERDTPWQHVYRGVFYRIHEEDTVSEHVTVENLRGVYRYLEIRIDNGDNPPLTVAGIDVARREASVVFESDGTGAYRLLGGNSKATSPQYDLERSMIGLGTQELPEVNIGTRTYLEVAEKLAPWTERNAVFLWIVLVAAVVAMVLLIGTSLRGAGQADSAPGEKPE